MNKTLSEHIRKDVAARLAAGGIDNDGLTLARLAKEYQVSLTPVRQAVHALLDAGVLQKSANGRLSPALPKQSTRKTETAGAGTLPVLPEPTSSTGALMDALLREIVASAVGEEVSYLREEATAKRNGVGRTAIRHALSQLAGRGLVEHIPRCGWKVRQLDEDDLRSYLDVREVMELKALELAAPHLEHDDLERMLQGNQPEDGRQRLDNNLHAYLVEKANNAYISNFFRQHGAYYHVLFDFAAPEVQVVTRMARQHRDILRNLIAEDWSAAREALAVHIRAQHPILVELLQRWKPER